MEDLKGPLIIKEYRRVRTIKPERSRQKERQDVARCAQILHLRYWNDCVCAM